MTAPPPKKSTKKLTRTQITRRAELRKLDAGGLRLPKTILAPEPSNAIRRLVESGYATSVTAAIERAALEAISNLAHH